MNDIFEIKNKINLINNQIEILIEDKNNINSDISFTDKEKMEYIKEIDKKIEKKIEILKKYQKELTKIENEHNIILINNVKKTALESINGLVSNEQFYYYQDLLNKTNEIDNLKLVIETINDIVRNDYINKITNIESYNPNKPYRLLCHCISSTGFNIENDYTGEYISCSLLTNEQNDTYNSNFGLIYPPQNIIAASSSDLATNNYTNNIDQLLTTQIYPTIQNIDSVIKETSERKRKTNEKEYNEIVIKNTAPIAIFYKGDDYDNLDSFTKSSIEKLKLKYPNLKVIRIPKSTNYLSDTSALTGIHHPRANELNKLEKQKLIAKQNNDQVAYNYAQSEIEKIIKESRLQTTQAKWNTMSIQDKITYVKIKINETKILHNQDEFNYWNSILNSLNKKTGTIDDIKEILYETEEYETLIHGTKLTEQEISDLIFQNGLNCTGKNSNSSLLKTGNIINLRDRNTNEIKTLFENWPHNSDNLVIVAIPKNYQNIYCTDTTDLDCRKTRAMMEKIQVNDGYKYRVQPKFIIGSYNIKTGIVTFNPKFEKKLTEETKKQLQTNLENLYKEMGLNIEEINETIKQEPQTKKDYNYYFSEIVKATQKYNQDTQMTEEQKKQLFGEIFYNEGYLIESLSTDEEIRQIMTRLTNELGNNQLQIKLQNIILTEIQKKYKQLHLESKQKQIFQDEYTFNNNNNNLDLSGLISKLRIELNQVQTAYRSMLSDGYIDDDELATLVKMINKIINNGYSLKTLATNPNDLKILSIIINSLEDEKKKMIKLQNGIEEIGKILK